MNSKKLFAEACELMPGGVNSPVRAFGSVGGSPVFMKKASGAWMWDEDNQRYVDYISSWGPAIVGHAHPEVVEAVQKAVVDGMSFGTPTARENILAAMICDALPSVDMIRFVSSGTEACMSALRVARAFTRRTKVLKFEGCYHGHADFLLVKPGSGVATLGLSGSPGVPEAAARDTLTCPYNNLAAIEECFHDNGPELAAVILEPIVGNAGFIRPVPGFLERLRELCDQYGTVLIFDEVMTGFRVAWGGYQNTSKIRPDMTVLGKVIGGGLPVGAYGGKREIMSMVAPSGPVYQAGTLSGNPVAMASGIKTLEILSRKVTIGSGLEDAYARLGALSQRLMTGMKQAASAAGISLQVDHEGGMFGFFFSASPVLNFADAQKSDTDSFRMFFNAMLDAGFYFAPSAFEAGFLSLAHTDSDIDDTVAAFTGFCASLRRGV